VGVRVGVRLSNQKGTHKQFTMQAVVVAIAKIMHVCTRQL
jgi:hypothetical protein